MLGSPNFATADLRRRLLELVATRGGHASSHRAPPTSRRRVPGVLRRAGPRHVADRVRRSVGLRGVPEQRAPAGGLFSGAEEIKTEGQVSAVRRDRRVLPTTRTTTRPVTRRSNLNLTGFEQLSDGAATVAAAVRAGRPRSRRSTRPRRAAPGPTCAGPPRGPTSAETGSSGSAGARCAWMPRLPPRRPRGPRREASATRARDPHAAVRRDRLDRLGSSPRITKFSHGTIAGCSSVRARSAPM